MDRGEAACFDHLHPLHDVGYVVNEKAYSVLEIKLSTIQKIKEVDYEL